MTTASTIAGSFFDFLKDLRVEEDGYDSAEVRVTEELRDHTEWSVAAGVGHSLARRMETSLRAAATW